MHTRVVIDKGDISPSIAMDDRILLGEGLFETLRVDSSMPCSVFMHWQRLSSSAQKLGIPFDLSFEELQEHLIAKIKRDNLYHGGIKVILSGGSAPRGLAEKGQVSQLMFQTFNYSVQKNPLKLISVPWLRDATNPIYQLKSVNYLEAITARRLAIEKGADDALFFNTQLHATETTCANLFLILDNELYTPLLEDGVLPGITRARIINGCAQQEIICNQKSLTKSMIHDAQAVFITNSLQGIRPVESIDSVSFAQEHLFIDKLTAMLEVSALDGK